ncbi:hypothetical protein [Pseudomonas panipatensis]|uniref:D-xylose transport system permease protein n=1 Tax=Pseudomonas panipatensis TaxID=428992 RepID=A0A1G8LCL5_9PSED|nr:hypothetical protein [Pseudomonas panipatensis]SDI53469.1 hypothetical protein SAMN05216272_11180 [Pseudomonas panipatensis]SMP75159.1 hypothetical protein SAMN06295951_113120 [Pseudomonas panipatensis]
MRRLCLSLLILWVHLGDLASAWLYHGGAWPQAAQLRPLRDLLSIALALACLLTLRLPTKLLLPILAYGALAALYLLAGWGEGMASGILVGSLGTLLIPMLFFLAGYYGIRDRVDLRRAASLLLLLGIASALFGAWDRQHSEFWIEVVRYPAYILDVKGVLIGANPDTGLPWNFYGGEELQRRAAGLLAAPLAQGMFLAVTALLALALRPLGARWLGMLLCGLLFVGIWMSGTRGAMLAGGIAVLGFLASARGLLRSAFARLALSAAALLAIAFASYGIVQMSLEMRDGSTVGHWMALQKNLADLPQVWLLGAGLGHQGGIAAQNGLSMVGGGEGALFSVAFQLGVPTALVFLAFFLSVAQQLWRAYRHTGDSLALALFWLALGIATTLISSEHVLSVSATAAFWLMCGGALRANAVAAAVAEPRVAMEPGSIDE